MNVNSVNIRAPNLECLLALSHCALLILPTNLIHRSLPPWPGGHADKTICSSVTAEVQAGHPLPPRWKSYSCLADVNNHTSWPCHLCKLPRPQTAFAVNPPPTRRQPVGVEDANLRSRSKHTHFSVHPGTWPTVGLHTSVSACSVHSAQLHSAFCKMWVDMWWTPPVEVGSRARHVPWTLAAPSFLLRHTRLKVNRRKRQVPGHGSTNVISLDLWPPVSSCLNCLALHTAIPPFCA